MPSRSAVATARLDGADTATIIGIPARAAFCTISKLVRPDTTRTASASGKVRARAAAPDELVDRVVAADVLAYLADRAVGTGEGGAVEPARDVEERLHRPQAVGQRNEGPDRHRRTRADRRAGDGELIERRLAADTTARTRGERPGAGLEIDGPPNPDGDDVVLLLHVGRQAVPHLREVVGVVDDPFGQAEARGELEVVPRGPHDHGERPGARSATRPGSPWAPR